MRYDKALGAFVELAASRHNAVHMTEAADVGMRPDRLRIGEAKGYVRRLHPRVWSSTALPATPKQTLRGCTLSIPGSAATTVSAAGLHGWTQGFPAIPRLWVPKTRTRPHPVADLQRWQRIDPKLDVTIVDHIPTLNKAATLCSLGPHVDGAMLERCLDEFLRTSSVRWLDDTMERLGSRKPGGVRALASLRNEPHRVQGVAESWFERVLARLLAQADLPPLVLQHPVVAGGRNYRLDLACPKLKLGAEAHSRSFHFGPGKQDADNVRDLHLSGRGWQVLYVTWSQIREPDIFVEQFVDAASARAALFAI